MKGYSRHLAMCLSGAFLILTAGCINNTNDGQCEDGATSLRAALASSGGESGEMIYHAFPAGCREFIVNVSGFVAGGYDVTVKSVVLGQITVGADGTGQLVFSDAIGNFPANFPDLAVGDPADVGSLATGNFVENCPAAPVVCGDDHHGDGGDQNTNGTGLTIVAATPSATDDRLYISGRFGDTPGEVFLNNTSLHVVSWPPQNPQPQQIVCDLPRDLYGDLQVQAGGLTSNVVQITRWDFMMLSHTVVTEPNTISGHREIDISAHFIIRACLNDLLHAAPQSFTVSAAVSRGSTAAVDALGTESIPPPATKNSETLTASSLPQTFRVVYPGDSYDPNTDLFVIKDLSCSVTRNGAGGGSIRLIFTIFGQYKLTQTIDGMSSDSNIGTGFAANSYFDTTQPEFTLDGGFTILGGMVAAPTDPNSTLTWLSAQAQSPPRD